MPAPIAIDDLLSASANTPIILSIADLLLANDSDPDGDPLTLASFDQPANGTLVDNGDGTLTYTPNAGYVGQDTFNYTVSDGTLTDNATVTVDVLAFRSDVFDAASLDPLWSIQGPNGSAQLTASGGEAYLEMTVAAGSNMWGSNKDATRVMQAAADEDFGIEAKFLSAPSEHYQMQGLLIEQDADNWIRFDTYRSGSDLHLFAAITNGGSSSPRFNLVIPDGSASYLRATRSGDDWTLDYSADGQTWTTGGSFTHAMTVSSVGTFAGSAAGSNAYTAEVDYFFNTAAPLTDEAGVPSPPAASDDALATDTDAALQINIASDLLANDSDPDGDPLTFVSFDQPANGALIDNGDGTLTYTPNTGYVGQDTFGYTISDGVLTDNATVTVDVAAIGAPSAPSALDDLLTVDADMALNINIASDLLANDSDPDGDPLTLASFGQPANGTLLDNGDGTLTYTPNTGYIGQDTFSYTVSDGTLTDTATVTIDISAPGAEVFSDIFDAASLDPLWSIQGPNGSAQLTASGGEAYLEMTVAAGSNMWGSNKDATRVMQAAADEDFGIEAKFLSAPSEHYQMQGLLIEQDADNWIRFDTYRSGSDLHLFAAITNGGSSSPRFNLVIPDGSASYLRATRSGDDWTLDYSADGQTWTTGGSFTHAMTVSSVGTFAGSAAGSNAYTAEVDYFFNTAAPLTDEAGVPSPPAASDDALATDTDAALQINIASDLLANDSDPDGDPLTFVSFDQPANGALIDNGDGTLTYTPNTGYVGQDTFGYTISDGVLTDNATVTVDVAAIGAPSAPSALDDLLTVDADMALNINIASDLLANDSDPDGDPLTLASFGQPANGTLLDNGDGTLTYTPNTGYIGQDTFSYTVSDGTLTDTATVTIDISAPGAEVFSDIFDAASLDPLWSIQGPNGSAQLTASGGEAYLEMTVAAGSNMWGSNKDATRVMQAAADEDFGIEAKFLSAPSEHYQMQGLLIEQDADNWIRFDTFRNGNELRLFAAVTVDGLSSSKFNFVLPEGAASHLRANRSGDTWTMEYSADGQTWTTGGSFTHALTVASVGTFAGSASTADAYTAEVDYFFNTAAPLIDEVPAPPLFAGDDTLSVNVDENLVIDVSADLLANDNDPQGDPFSIVGNTQPSNGTLLDNGDGTWSYQPNNGYIGQDSFTYDISDGNDTATATVTITVIDPTNDAPTAVNDTVNGIEDQAVVIAAIANDTDPNGDSLTISSVTQPSSGTVQLNPDQTISYTPAPNTNGPDSFTYTISDGRGGSSQATVNISIAPAADAPVGGQDLLSTSIDTGLPINVQADLLINDFDPDGDTITFVGFAQPTHGQLVDNGDGTLTYTPINGFSGTDSFEYTISDGSLTSLATVDVLVRDEIEVWYGTNQNFSVQGTSQDYINILGNADPNYIESLSYSLNGDVEIPLSLGPDSRRLLTSGDFNIDIHKSELDGSSVDDVVEIRATLFDGSIVTKQVVVAYDNSQEWSTNYSIDWDTVSDLQDVVQVVDGLWTIESNGLRIAEPGYDRIVSLGDNSWDSYEVNLTMTVNQIQGHPTGVNGQGFGFGWLWDGHTDDPVPGFQPKAGWNPLATAFYRGEEGAEEFRLYTYPKWGDIDDRANYVFEEGSKYNFTVRIEQTNDFDYTYSTKVWEEGTTEPANWLIQATEIFSEPVTGSFVLIAHYWDVTYGNITVTEITGSDIIQGNDTDETFLSVNTNNAQPGLGEIDVFRGESGADTFIFADEAGNFYDDGLNDTTGIEDYALIWDFETGLDVIHLSGTHSDYNFEPVPQGFDGDTAIYHVNGNPTNELIAVVRNPIDTQQGTSDIIFLDEILV